MAESINVKIPAALFERIINLLLCWDTAGYDELIQDDLYEVIYLLLKKRQSLDLRHDYAKIINAPDKDSRDQARLRYLQIKREIFGEET